jgi:hypothetical protein
MSAGFPPPPWAGAGFSNPYSYYYADGHARKDSKALPACEIISRHIEFRERFSGIAAYSGARRRDAACGDARPAVLRPNRTFRSLADIHRGTTGRRMLGFDGPVISISVQVGRLLSSPDSSGRGDGD